jgi:hypothetical protein
LDTIIVLIVSISNKCANQFQGYIALIIKNLSDTHFCFQFAILSYLVVSTSCLVLHQQPLPLLLDLQYNNDPNYMFAYDVNNPQTGDIKNQQESRRGDIVLGQYSLVQPDGVRRTVEYKADDHSGFQATVNNEVITPQEPTKEPEATEEPPSQPNVAVIIHPWPTPSYSTTTLAPVAISRTSFHQTIASSRNPWL